MASVNDMIEDETPENISALSAVGVGIASIRNNQDTSSISFSDHVTVIGVIENWDVIGDGDCTERSYGCVYVEQ